VTYQQFIAKFPEFRNVAPGAVCSALDEASCFVDACVWGNKRDQGIGYWAANALAISPFGTNTQLQVGTGRTSYQVKFEELRTSVVGGFMGASPWYGGR
jgi:hypothetical protein